MAVATAVQRSFLRGGRRVSFAGRRSSFFGTPAHAPARRAAVARSRFASSGRRERARPPRDATRGNGAVHGALDLRWVIWGCLGRARAAPSLLFRHQPASQPAGTKHAPHPPHPPATPRRAPWGATPRRRASMAVATAVQRSFLRGGRRVSFAGRRSSFFGTPAHAPARRAAVARSRFASSGRRERARPPRDATRGNGAVHGALDLRWVIWGCLGRARAAPSSLLFSTPASKPASSRLSNSQVRASQNSRRQPPPASARDCCFVFVFVSNRAAVKSSRTAAVKPSSQQDRGEFPTESR